VQVTRLVLWDVDHTLIENAGVSKEIYAAAFVALTGRQACHIATTEGRTDPDIMAELFRKHGEPTRPWPQTEQALTEAGCQYRRALAERGRVLPGVVDVIEALAALPQVAQTIVTGNIRANAATKLAAFMLTSWFDLAIGGYGSDDPDRSRLVTIAKARAAAKHGSQLTAAANVVVIGDTPRDIEAAQLGGARALAVGSGIHGVEELRAAGPAYVIPSLVDTAAVVRFVLSPLAPDGRGPSEPP
jgi:phosphoglycolate phosphatase-like HAD superfamily hydrolase